MVDFKSTAGIIRIETKVLRVGNQNKITIDLPLNYSDTIDLAARLDSHNPTKHTLETLSKAVSMVRKKRFPRRNKTKYGNLPRGFTPEQLDLIFGNKEKRILGAFKPHDYRFKFFCRVLLAFGLRVGEALEIKLDDVDLGEGKLIIHRSKGEKAQCLRMSDSLLNRFRDYSEEYKTEIEKANRTLFFSLGGRTGKWSDGYLRRWFRRILFRVPELNKTYGVSESFNSKHKERLLYSLTLHSFRYTFIWEVYKLTKDLKETQRAAGHESVMSTDHYVNNLTQFEVSDLVVKVQNSSGLNRFL